MNTKQKDFYENAFKWAGIRDTYVNKQGERVEVSTNYTSVQFAEALGLTTPTVNRLFKQLEKLGLAGCLGLAGDCLFKSDSKRLGLEWELYKY
jgi:hypothetical protein